MIKRIIITIAAAAMLFSCATYSTSLNDDWTEEQFFKTAQQAYDRDSLNEALFYYEVYLLRYPQNHTKGIAAEYERAYILYKKGDSAQSRLFFETILEKYDSNPYAYLYPEAYRVLTEKVLARMSEQEAIKELPFLKRGKARKFGLESVLEEEESIES